MADLARGLKLLNQSDPCVQVLLQETGEHVIVTAGELHLERCLKDLRERFARIDIQASATIVPFRETVRPIPSTKASPVLASFISANFGSLADRLVSVESTPPCGRISLLTPNRLCEITLRAIPLPWLVTEFLFSKERELCKLFDNGNSVLEDSSFMKDFEAAVNEASKEGEAELAAEYLNDLSSLLDVGPKKSGGNILIDQVPDRFAVLSS